MKSVPKLIRRFVGILLIGSFLLLLLNIGLLLMIGATQTSSGSPYKTADEIARALRRTENGYTLDAASIETLKKDDVWAICIDNETRQVVWNTDNLPENIPRQYSLSDISELTLGYIEDYPTYAGEAEDGLVVLGYPKDRYWKSMWPTWDYEFIAHLPQTLFSVVAVNVALIFLIYVVVNTKLLRSVKPITNGIQALPAGEPVQIKEKGLLSEVAVHINRTSEVLQSQNYQLRKKETARANWIAGVSHDIRTPLSMVMGYAGQLKDDPHLTDNERQKAAVIVKQSQRIRSLINDLNLASKLEYNMQPINPTRENIIALARQVVVDFINMDISDKHPIVWETDETLTVCPVNVDKDLIKRAISNLIQNSMNHNEQGCKIFVSITTKDGNCNIEVSDDGLGATEEEIQKLNTAPHYMVCDENITEQRHGLGLLIVKQIIASHGGITTIDHSSHHGFSVILTLPIQN
ncbi:MAG: HAMP domain-containing sensor histidine kinase [Bacillota bacterium]|nr:HAMP domain-containing sensor histidine kinase [Bacillota bacterium]